MRLKIKYGKCLIQFGILVVSVVVIILQVVHYTNSQSPLLKRALSFINLNDFSWRNRIMSWESSASMIGDHLCQNTGWHQSPLIQSEYYIPIGSAETPDLNLNSYLLIGCVFGLLVLCAWIYYLRLVLWRKPNHGNTQLAVLPTNFIYESEAQFICRAGATVLLVSMWFEGGLFTVPIAFIFWTLVEVGRRDLWKTAILKTTSRSQSEVSDSE